MDGGAEKPTLWALSQSLASSLSSSSSPLTAFSTSSSATAEKDRPSQQQQQQESYTGMEEKRTWTIDELEDLIGLGPFQFFLLLIAGLGFAADCMEVTLMSFMGNGVGHEWGLSTHRTLAWLGFAVFGGEFVGCLIWGPVSDRWGRQKAYLASCIMMLVFSIASALSPSFPFLLVTRALVGFGIGGLSVPFDLLCEVTPTKYRGTMLLMMQMFWVLGSVVVVGMAWGTLEEHGWRYLTLVASTPLLVATLAIFCLPESPRWLLEEGQTEKAWQVLVTAARWNGRKDLHSDLINLRCTETPAEGVREERRKASMAATATAIVVEEGREQGAEEEPIPSAAPAPAAAAQDICPLEPHHHHPSSSPLSSSSFLSTLPLLLSAALRATTLWLWVIWFSFGLLYYGIIVLSASIFSSEGEAGTEHGELFDYPTLMFAAASEVGTERRGREALGGFAVGNP
ncbi:hypothetical protein VYU27_007310 [Nannochloropsis oceanica]